MSARAVAVKQINVTPQEGLNALRLLWAAVEEYEISLDPPRRGGGTGLWLAGCAPEGGERLWAHGETPVEAVEELLRQIGGESHG